MGGFCNEMCFGCVGCTAQEQRVEKIFEVLWGAGFMPPEFGGWVDERFLFEVLGSGGRVEEFRVGRGGEEWRGLTVIIQLNLLFG